MGAQFETISSQRCECECNVKLFSMLRSYAGDFFRFIFNYVHSKLLDFSGHNCVSRVGWAETERRRKNIESMNARETIWGKQSNNLLLPRRSFHPRERRLVLQYRENCSWNTQKKTKDWKLIDFLPLKRSSETLFQINELISHSQLSHFKMKSSSHHSKSELSEWKWLPSSTSEHFNENCMFNFTANTNSHLH